MNIAFFGSGNMGSALACAAAKSCPQDEILVTDQDRAKAEILAKKVNGQACTNETAAANADWLFLCVKPQFMESLLFEIGNVLRKRTDPYVLVTIAAGLTTDTIRQWAQVSAPILRLMPNTPCAIGAGMMSYACGADVDSQTEENFLKILSQAGRCVKLSESLIDAGTAVAGCGPAYACLFLEALADGGVACGLSRAAAMEMAAQTLLGTAQLVLESGQHPGELKDAVCSPAGSTIYGVRTLEERGFRGAVLDAVLAAYDRNRELGKK